MVDGIEDRGERGVEEGEKRVIMMARIVRIIPNT